MKNNDKTREQLLEELEKSNAKIAELEKSEVGYRKSEEQFRLIAENTSDLITLNTLDLKASYTYVSPSIKAMSGFDPEDLLGRSAFEFIHPDDKVNLSSSLKKYVNIKIKKLLTGKEIPLNETIEYRANDKSGNWHYFQSTGNIVGDQLLFVSRDITERKQTEQKLREHNQVIEQLQEGIAITDIDGKFVFANPAWAEMHGYRVDDLIGKPAIMLDSPEDRKNFPKLWEEINKKGFWRGELRRVRKDGSSFSSIMTSSLMKDDRNKPIGIVGACLDITERKQAEKKLQENEKQLQTLIDAMPDFVCFKDEDGRWLKANNACIRIFQLESIDYRGKKDSELAELNSNLRGTFLTCEKTDAKARKEEGLFHGEETILDPGGSVRAYDVTKLAVIQPGGETKGLVVLGHDITERKQAEEVLKESEGKFRLLADNSIDVIWQMNLKLLFTYVSQSIVNMTGHTVDEWVGSRLSDHSTTKEFFNMAKKALHGIKNYKKIKHANFEATILHKNGNEIPVEISSKLLFNKKGLPIGLQGTTRDITNRKKAEKVLKESEQRFRSYFEMSLIGMAITSVEKRWIDANDKMCEILGYSLDELKQKTWVELTHPDDQEADLEKFNQVLENRIDSYSMEKRFFRENGSLVFTKKSVGCVRNSDGSVNYIVLLMEDITDRKIDEIVIRKSEERWQFALEGSGDGVWDWSIQLNEVFFSKQWKAMLGFKEDEISGNPEEWDKRIHPDDIEKVHKDIQKHLDGITPVYENEHRIQCKDGSYKWIYSRGKVISRTKEEKPLRMIGTHSDITGRKRANEELRKSEDRLRFMAENTGDVLYRLQYDTMKFEYISPAITVLTGYTAEEINKTGFLFLVEQTIIPEAPDVSPEELRKKRIEGTVGEWRAEYKIRSKSGEEKWLGDHSFPWKDDSGKIIGSIGILQNITEHMLSDLELAKHREHLEDLVKERTGEVERSQKSLVLLMEDVNEVNQELYNVNTILDATNKELEAFSYSVSHDLRAPLTRMDGFSKALINSHSDKLDDQAVHFLNRIRVSSQNMAKLIDDLLSLSRITREKVYRQKVDLSQTAGKIVKELKASEPGRKVDFEIAKGLSANADRKFVVIILENLLGNAFKFTGKKKNAIIEFDKKTIDNKEVFFIKDNGAGFNMKYYNKIFTAFQRLHSDEEFKGTGIGLAIVQRIINKHGGKIWAESEVGEGTTFYFRFE